MTYYKHMFERKRNNILLFKYLLRTRKVSLRVYVVSQQLRYFHFLLIDPIRNFNRDK